MFIFQSEIDSKSENERFIDLLVSLAKIEDDFDKTVKKLVVEKRKQEDRANRVTVFQRKPETTTTTVNQKGNKKDVSSDDLTSFCRSILESSKHIQCPPKPPPPPSEADKQLTNELKRLNILQH